MGHPRTEDGTPLHGMQVGPVGYQMCDRDIKLVTHEIVEAASFEDVKPALSQDALVTPHTYLRVGWGEVSLEGVFKLDAGAYVACATQGDADANAELSVWNMACKNPADQELIPWAIAGGGFNTDVAIAGDLWAHQLYVIGASDIPAVVGGQARFFDAYMACGVTKTLRTHNPESRLLDPTVEGAPAGASTVKILLYYPKGELTRTHVLRLRTYRPAGTF